MKLIIIGTALVLSSLCSLCQDSLYIPFEGLRDLTGKEFFEDGYMLRDTNNCILFSCENFPVLIERLAPKRFLFEIDCYGPPTYQRVNFVKFNLNIYSDRYEFFMDSICSVDTLLHHLSSTITIENSNLIGFISLVMLIQTMEIKYLHILAECQINSPSDSILIWYREFLEVIGVTTNSNWSRSKLGNFKLGKAKVSYKPK